MTTESNTTRVTSKNIRVTEGAHLLLATLAEILDVSFSEAIEHAVEQQFPEVVELAQKRQRENQELRNKLVQGQSS